MPELLKKSGVYTHLTTDHYHYWQDGGATYHNRYSSCELFRGQEGDAWKGEVKRPDLSVLHDTTRMRRQFSSALMEQELINRKMKVKAKVAKKNLKYLNRTAAALKKLAKGEPVDDEMLALPDPGGINK